MTDFDIQLMLFKMIREKQGNSSAGIKELQKLLRIADRPLRNRMTGRTYLTLAEFYRLSLYYAISINDIAQRLEKAHDDAPDVVLKPQDGHGLPLLTSDLNELPLYMLSLQQEFEQLLQADKPLLKMVCADVPLMQLMAFEELTYFKIYMYYVHFTGLKLSFEQFVKKIESCQLKPYFDRINEIYSQINSFEIWDEHTINSLLRLLEECAVYGKFEQEATLSRLLDQFDLLVANLITMLQEGGKPAGGQVEFFNSDAILRKNFTLLETAQGPKVLQSKLFMLQMMSTTDAELMGYMDQTFDSLIERSNSLSKTSHYSKGKLIQILQAHVKDYRDRLLAPLQASKL